MKSVVLGSVALIAIGVSFPAHAADMAVKAPPPPPTTAAPYNWSGLYFGGNFGGAWTSGNLTIPGNNFYGGLTEFIAGVQAGYNVQAGHFLFGVEGDFDWATFDHPTLPFPTLGSVSQHWIGTAAARVSAIDLNSAAVQALTVATLEIILAGSGGHQEWRRPTYAGGLSRRNALRRRERSRGVCHARPARAGRLLACGELQSERLLQGKLH